MTETTDPIIVWLIEDHKAYGERLVTTLNRMDGIECQHRFTACEDARDALKTEPPPRVLLIDLELPGMNGLDFIPYFRQQSPQTAIIILTVFQDDDKIFRAICAGAIGYLLKTTSNSEIANAIRGSVSGESPITPAIARRVIMMLSKISHPQKEYGLSPREKEILTLLVQGYTIKLAARELGIGFYTADEYIRSVYEKLQVHSRASAIAKAVNEQLVQVQVKKR